MNIKKHIPNAITCGNLLCGCLALIKAFGGDLEWAAYLVGIALVLDFFDGFTARLLKVSSAIGKDLDSLADMVTFGVVPGIVMFSLLRDSLKSVFVTELGWNTVLHSLEGLSYLALIIPILSAIRLAKFNNDTRQSDSFIGMPTPANAMIICSLPLILKFNPELIGITNAISNPLFLIGSSFVLSFLLVAEIPLFALKFRNFSWADNKIRFIFLALAITLLISLKFVGIPLVILFYILLSIVNNIFSKKKV